MKLIHWLGVSICLILTAFAPVRAAQPPAEPTLEQRVADRTRELANTMKLEREARERRTEVTLEAFEIARARDRIAAIDVDQRARDEREHEHDQDEERRQPEAQGPEHLGIRVTAYAAGVGERSDATL